MISHMEVLPNNIIFFSGNDNSKYSFIEVDIFLFTSNPPHNPLHPINLRLLTPHQTTPHLLQRLLLLQLHIQPVVLVHQLVLGLDQILDILLEFSCGVREGLFVLGVFEVGAGEDLLVGLFLQAQLLGEVGAGELEAF
jgi:hypothetical protein